MINLVRLTATKPKIPMDFYQNPDHVCHIGTDEDGLVIFLEDSRANIAGTIDTPPEPFSSWPRFTEVMEDDSQKPIRVNPAMVRDVSPRESASRKIAVGPGAFPEGVPAELRLILGDVTRNKVPMQAMVNAVITAGGLTLPVVETIAQVVAALTVDPPANPA